MTANNTQQPKVIVNGEKEKTEEVLAKKSVHELHARMKELLDEQWVIPIMGVPEESRQAYASWRQAFGSSVMWFGNFARYKDYSSSVNAAMALGKFDGMAIQPTTLVSQAIQEEILTTGNLMWEAIQANAGRLVPFEK